MRIFVFGFILISSFAVSAQDTLRILTLQECVDMANSRNLTIKQNQNNLLAAESNKRQAYYNFLPNLNASANYSYFDGNQIDFEGNVVSNTSRSSRPSIGSNMVIFNAFANHHLLNRRKHEFEAAMYQLEDSRIITKATVIRNYLSVLVTNENVKISDQRLAFLEEQLTREEKRVSVGVGSLDAVYNFRSQVANERLNNVTLRNQFQSSRLQLLQSIQIEEYRGVAIAPLDIAELETLQAYDRYDEVLDEIISYSFQLKSAEENAAAAESQMKQTRADRFPDIALGASHARNYTSVLQDVSYVEQIESTPTNSVGMTLRIPIFNRYQIQNGINNAKVSMMNAQLQRDQTMLDVTNAAQRDYLDLVAAQTSFKTAQENFEALSQTFEFVKKRFETGNTDFFTYLESLNNKNQAEAQLVNAKFTILLRKQILDLYRGKQATL